MKNSKSRRWRKGQPAESLHPLTDSSREKFIGAPDRAAYFCFLAYFAQRLDLIRHHPSTGRGQGLEIGLSQDPAAVMWWVCYKLEHITGFA
ncbi:hypothetical protein F4823DRAFT_574506 [Ustulina deusta]|nr:hypothetical protein F4823DRAFT_574506 [Ustulina deusta]